MFCFLFSFCFLLNSKLRMLVVVVVFGWNIRVNNYLILFKSVNGTKSDKTCMFVSLFFVVIVFYLSISFSFYLPL